MTTWTMETSGGTSGSLGNSVFPITINVKDFGAKGDGKRVTDGAMTNGFPWFDSATAGFTSLDIGKVVLVTGAGTAPSTLQSTISQIISATRVQLAANATATVSGAQARYGSDDTIPLQAAFTAAKSLCGKLVVPRGRYFTTFLDVSRFNTSLKSQLIIEGEGFQESIIQHIGTNVCVYLGGSNFTIWRDISIDSNDGRSQVGVLACRLSDAPRCSNHLWQNFGTPVGSVWLKAPFVGISTEETTQDRCNYDNEGGTTGTLYYTNKNTQIAVTLPNSDTINESSAVANRIVDCSITTANAGAADVTVEYGAEVAILGRTYLGIVGATTTSVGVRIAGDVTNPSYGPVVIDETCDIEMNGGPTCELKSYAGANTIAGPIIKSSFIPQSTQIIAYAGAGTIVTNGLTYEGNYEYQTACTLTLTGTHNFPQITMTGVNTNVVLSSGATIASPRIFARSFTDSGATLTGLPDLRSLTKSGATVASMSGNRPQSFMLEITNTAGTIQHHFLASVNDLTKLGVFADRITGASGTLANTATVAVGTPFTSGGGILSGTTNTFLLDTADQVDDAFADGEAVIEANDTGSAVLAVKYSLRSDNINGVIRFRPAFSFANATTNAVFALTVGNIPAGKILRVRFRGGIA